VKGREISVSYCCVNLNFGLLTFGDLEVDKLRSTVYLLTKWPNLAFAIVHMYGSNCGKKKGLGDLEKCNQIG
jgi:hypothetical protein